MSRTRNTTGGIIEFGEIRNYQFFLSRKEVAVKIRKSGRNNNRDFCERTESKIEIKENNDEGAGSSGTCAFDSYLCPRSHFLSAAIHKNVIIEYTKIKWELIPKKGKER